MAEWVALRELASRAEGCNMWKDTVARMKRMKLVRRDTRKKELDTGAKTDHVFDRDSLTWKSVAL